MPERMMYRVQILRAVEAFLEKTPLSLALAHHIIKDCDASIHHGAENTTVSDLVWSFPIQALTDSVFYENDQFLQETREMLLGRRPQDFSRTVVKIDYRPYFVEDDAQWYTQLVELYHFVLDVPFTAIHDAAFQARQQKMSWAQMRRTIPEVAQAETIDQEYTQMKTGIQELLQRNPSTENIEDEKIAHLVLQEITAILTNLMIGKAAVYFGYPTSDGLFSWYGDDVNSISDPFNMLETVQWTKKSLDALAGERPLFLSWRLGKHSSSISDVLVLSLH